LQKQGDYLKAALIARNMSTNETFDGDKAFATTYNILKNSKEYTGALARLANSLNKEMSLRQPYIEAFTNKDSLWWKNEIKANETKIKSETDIYMQDMYRRIKGFWGIVCYSLGKQAIQQHNAEELNKVVAIYHALEPDNSYVYYYAAFPYLWQGNNAAAVASLKKALKLGFTDMKQLKVDFPEQVSNKVLIK